jgi:putative flippase GtrA
MAVKAGQENPAAALPLPVPLRFLLAGGVAAALNFGSRILLSLILPYPVAVTLAYFFGMAAAFALNRRYVFTGSTNPLHQQALWFVTVNLVALLQTLAVSVLLADFILPRAGLTWHADEIAHAVGIVTPILTSYLGHRRFTFR